jgi:hypothetical protein
VRSSIYGFGVSFQGYRARTPRFAVLVREGFDRVVDFVRGFVRDFVDEVVPRVFFVAMIGVVVARPRDGCRPAAP